MKGKAAKIGGRARGNTEVVTEKVSIQYHEVTVTNPDTAVSETFLVRSNFGMIEAASENAPGWVGNPLDAFFESCEECDFIVESSSLVGINYLRLSLPRLDAQLKHFAPKE